MSDPIKNLSLRARLAILSAFVVAALVVALFVAWRLARATETFALRQADATVTNASRDLSRAVAAYPAGYVDVTDATADDEAPHPGRSGRGGRGERDDRPVPPPVEEAFKNYSDPLSRLTAVTLHRSPNTTGGFYQAPPIDSFTGLAVAAPPDGATAPDIATAAAVRSLALDAVRTGTTVTRTIDAGSDRILLAATPVRSNGADQDSSPVKVAWAAERVSNIAGVSDRANLAALIALGLCIVAVAGLAVVTVRDLRSGVTSIESGLANMRSDLTSVVEPLRTLELSRIASAINEMARALRTNQQRQIELETELRRNERLSSLGRVAAGVAHEVRNPLASMKLKVQLARRQAAPNGKLDDTFRVLTEEIDRLNKLVTRLLEFGREKPQARRAVDLGQLVIERVDLFSELAAQSKVSIDTSRCAGGLIVIGDQDRLGQVIDNLLQNAIDAQPDGGSIVIECEKAGGIDSPARGRISIKDQGPGISLDDRARLFEPFFTGRDSGTGLGLALARAIVREHQGEIRSLDETGTGAHFVVELPLSPDGAGQ